MVLNYPFNHAHTAFTSLFLSPLTLLKIYFFGALVVAWLSILILSGSIDAVLLYLGYLPIFENISFATITVWNSIHNAANSGTITSQKLLSDLQTLKVLIIRPFVRDVCVSLLVTLLLLAGQEMCFHFQKEETKSVEGSQCEIGNVCETSSHEQKWIRLWSLGHVYVYGAILTVIVTTLAGPCRRLFGWWHMVIKDEKYLIGQELQNSIEVSDSSLLFFFSSLTDPLLLLLPLRD
jgi:hypothetical protein